VTLIEKLQKIKGLKFSFGKNDEYHESFSIQINACSMHQSGFGLGIPKFLSPENKLRGIFTRITPENGIFVFNINGVNLVKAGDGFKEYNEAQAKYMITEWELSIILQNTEYLKKTIFHNGKVEFNKINNGISLLWK
jgi:hypothetical protein